VSGEVFHHVGFVGGIKSEYLSEDEFWHEEYAPDKCDPHPYDVETEDLHVSKEGQGGEHFGCPYLMLLPYTRDGQDHC